MIGVYPLTDQVRQRVKRRQSEDEPGGWDRIELPPEAEIVPLDTRDRLRNHRAQGHQTLAFPPACKLNGMSLAVPIFHESSSLLDDVVLVPNALNVERRGTDGNEVEGAENAG
jgi:hypothetical protein